MDGLGGRQSGASSSVSSNRKQSLNNDSISPSTSINAKPNLPRKRSAMKPPPSLPAIRDPPSKLAELPFESYKRRNAPAFDPRSRKPASPADKGKAPVKLERVPSGMVQPLFSFVFSVLVKHPKPRVVRLHLRPKPSLLTPKS
jgi:hypothetical protein